MPMGVFGYWRISLFFFLLIRHFGHFDRSFDSTKTPKGVFGYSALWSIDLLQNIESKTPQRMGECLLAMVRLQFDQQLLNSVY